VINAAIALGQIADAFKFPDPQQFRPLLPELPEAF
jgi:hypothetical protein